MCCLLLPSNQCHVGISLYCAMGIGNISEFDWRTQLMLSNERHRKAIMSLGKPLSSIKVNSELFQLAQDE